MLERVETDDALGVGREQVERRSRTSAEEIRLARDEVVLEQRQPAILKGSIRSCGGSPASLAYAGVERSGE